jgi:hypothetical protein
MTFKLLLALAMSAVVLVGCEDSKSYVSLHHLCTSGDATGSQVQEFLDRGFDVNATEQGMFDAGMTPLMWAADRNENPEVISVLLKAGADVNAKHRSGRTALDYAKENESIKGTPAYWQLNDASFD